jgi:translation initiation factor 2B subunit (eIF-2B alpha/beta/delta family)
MDSSIAQIASNSTSGAAEILRLAGEVFSQLRGQADPSLGSVEQAQQAILETAIALVRAQPDMSPLLRLANVAISAASTATSAQDALKSAEDHTLKFIDTANRAVRTAALHAANLILPGATVMTHSRSSTVLAAFMEARLNGRSFSVVATESRPGLEGRALAEALAHEDIRVSLIADSAASLAMDDVDVVLVGADTITQEDLVNKIGTWMIGLAARERGLPFYAVCDSSKFINADYRCRPVRNEGSINLLWPDAPAEVLVVNGYFEPTPLALFSGIITEDGVLSTEEASRRAERASIEKQLLEALEELRQQIR